VHPDSIQHGREVVQNFIIPKSKNLIAIGVQM